MAGHDGGARGGVRWLALRRALVVALSLVTALSMTPANAVAEALAASDPAPATTLASASEGSAAAATSAPMAGGSAAGAGEREAQESGAETGTGQGGSTAAATTPTTGGAASGTPATDGQTGTSHTDGQAGEQGETSAAPAAGEQGSTSTDVPAADEQGTVPADAPAAETEAGATDPAAEKEAGATDPAASNPSADPTDPATDPAAGTSTDAETSAEAAVADATTRAPISSATLAPGTYTVTANLYVPAAENKILGIDAFLTNDKMPPVDPVSDNASLVVDADGTMHLTVPTVNEVFTLQDVKGAGNAQVEKTEKASSTVPTGTRITSVTFTLKDSSGFYGGLPATEYPAIMSGAVNFPLALAVDLANARGEYVPPTDGKTYSATVSAGDVTAAITTTESWGDRLAGSTLSFAGVSDELKAKIDANLSDFFDATPAYTVYDLSLAGADGAPVAISGNAKAQLTFKTGYAKARLYRVSDDGTLTDLGVTTDAGVLSYTAERTSGLGRYLVADTSSSAAWASKKVYLDQETGVMLTARGSGASKFSTQEYLDSYKLVSRKLTEGAYVDGAREAVKAAGTEVADDETTTVYAASLDDTGKVWLNAGRGPITSGFGSNRSASLGQVTLSVPAPAGSVVWRVERSSGGAYTATQVGVSQGTSVEASLVSSSDATSAASLSMSRSWNAATNKRWYMNKVQDQTDATPLVFFAVVSPKVASVEKPVAAQGLTYNAASQVGVAAGAGFELTGTQAATDAGTYTATATLKDGFVWSDGSTDPVDVTWTISRATLTATFTGATVTRGEKVPAGSVSLTGFVGGETQATVMLADPSFKVPTMDGADTSTAGVRQAQPQGGEAKNYRFVYVAGTLDVRASAETGSLKPGTYTVTANFSMPGQYNPVLPGVTVYPTNPNNPSGINGTDHPVIDWNDPSEVKDGIPMSPVSANAKLVVYADGTRTLLVPIKNPVFNMQALGTSTGVDATVVRRVSPKDPADWTYGRYATRIDYVAVRLTDTQTTGEVSYDFTGSALYATPLDLDIRPTSGIALQLKVDYGSVDASSYASSTELPGWAAALAPGGNGGGDSGEGGSGGETGDNGGQTVPGGGSGGQTQTEGTGDKIAVQGDGHLKAGTYTVTANIYVSRASSGLPLSPHITSGVFPPKDPVTNNATLRVDGQGRATLYLPIRIQSRIMTVQSVNGLDVIASTGGSALSSITIDLGVLTNPGSTVRRDCSVTITMGSLASTISGITGQHTWGATFEMNLSGAPTSGGGQIPAGALARLQNASSDVEGVTTEQAAEEALAALDAAGAEKNGPVAKIVSADDQKAKTDAGEAAAKVAEELAAHPALVAGAVVIVAGAVGAAVYASRRGAAGRKGRS